SLIHVTPPSLLGLSSYLGSGGGTGGAHSPSIAKPVASRPPHFNPHLLLAHCRPQPYLTGERSVRIIDIGENAFRLTAVFSAKSPCYRMFMFVYNGVSVERKLVIIEKYFKLRGCSGIAI
ncbi:hypothetical protein GWI33_022597, partial [Rhynchophorus ferrugineus]